MTHDQRPARIHISIGLVAFAILIIAFLLSASAAMGEKRRAVGVPGSDRKLIIANGAGYTTSLLAISQDDAAAQATIADCVLGGSGITFDLPAGGAAVERSVGSTFCSSAPIFLTDAPENILVLSILRFNSGAERSSFTVPALGFISDTVPADVGPLLSDDEEGAWITVFVDRPTPMHILLFDGAQLAPVIAEDFTATPPVYQHRVAARGIFFARVSLGYDYWRCRPSADCAAFGNVYGFASTGTPDGGTFRAFPFGE